MSEKLNTLSNLFEDKEIRSIWDSDKEDYYFSVVDVISAVTDSTNPRNYWNMLKSRLNNEGSELYTNCVQLKMKSSKDGKNYLTDTLDTEGVFRLIESVPSKKAEHPQGLNQNIKVAKRGGKVAKVARDIYEKETKKSALSKSNNLNYEYKDELLLEEN